MAFEFAETRGPVVAPFHGLVLPEARQESSLARSVQACRQDRLARAPWPPGAAAANGWGLPARRRCQMPEPTQLRHHALLTLLHTVGDQGPAHQERLAGSCRHLRFLHQGAMPPWAAPLHRSLRSNEHVASPSQFQSVPTSPSQSPSILRDAPQQLVIRRSSPVANHDHDPTLTGCHLPLQRFPWPPLLSDSGLLSLVLCDLLNSPRSSGGRQTWAAGTECGRGVVQEDRL